MIDWENRTIEIANPLHQQTDVLAFSPIRSNAVLIENCYRLGYITEDDRVLDLTYGSGAFWRLRRPQYLTTNDFDMESGAQWHTDFRQADLVWMPGQFDVVVFDPPYKLNGTPSGPMDLRYGVGQPTRWQDRMQQCLDGIAAACALRPRTLLIKCMDQVVSGRVRWQAREFANAGMLGGFRLVDELLMMSGRPQPDGRRQVHARRNYSNLLVMERGTQR